MAADTHDCATLERIPTVTGTPHPSVEVVHASRSVTTAVAALRHGVLLAESFQTRWMADAVPLAPSATPASEPGSRP